jgi:protein phosphatase
MTTEDDREDGMTSHAPVTTPRTEGTTATPAETQLTIAVGSDTGLLRVRNEDAFLVADVVGGRPAFDDGVAHVTVGARGALLAISDGMGGHRAGHVASAMTLESLYRALVERGSIPDLASRLEGAAEQANAEVRQAAQRPALEDMGATLTAIVVDGASAHVASVGDSRAYVIRGGRIHRLTRDQNLAQLAADSGALSPEEVAHSPFRSVLAQAMGHAKDLRVALSVLALRRDDVLVLCTDGLTNELSDDEIGAEILRAESLPVACRSLLDAANMRGGRDNITVVAARIEGNVPTVAEGDTLESTYRVLRTFVPPPL